MNISSKYKGPILPGDKVRININGINNPDILIADTLIIGEDGSHAVYIKDKMGKREQYSFYELELISRPTHRHLFAHRRVTPVGSTRCFDIAVSAAYQS